MDKLQSENQPMREGEIRKTGEGNLKARKIVYYLLGVLEVLLAFRLVLQASRSKSSKFLRSFHLFSITSVLIPPFPGFSNQLSLRVLRPNQF